MIWTIAKARGSLLAGSLLAVWPASLLAQGYAPDRAARMMTAAHGFNVSLVVSEPVVRKPVAIDFDERGRLWVMQYLQYPNPAGLKRVKVDRYSRTVYDRVPEPPPRGPKGDDRLTILVEDPAHPGQLAGKDFVAGLNLGSGFAFGHGGVFVLQVPYLLFYPDRDRDDVPDGDPDVLLSGFGMEDAHSVANSLTWGPDGWLYGCQGSTVTANIRGIEFQQGVWRYHPLTRRFELFCEGGGNSWGLDFDRHGNLLYSTNVGGFATLHGVQGGYYWKSFGKHGALHNPFAYGYFDHVPHQNFKGGHVTVGGIVYRGDSFPERLRGKYIGADLLGHAVYWHDVEAAGSSFRSRHGGDLLLANDTSFAPSDLTLGPDGCVYVADWHDKRTAHPDPDAEWDRTGGRVYRISYGDTKPVRGLDLAKKSSTELTKLLGHPNDWYARTARRVLADRRDPEIIFPLRTLVLEAPDDDLALQAFWALYVSGGFNETFAGRTLTHHNPDVRRWTVRFLGDECRVSPATARSLERLAEEERSAVVRSQLAASAKRLPAADALPIIRRLVLRDADRGDPHIPLLLWWAVERHAIEAIAPMTEFFTSTEAWRSALARETILPRLVRRYAAEGSAEADDACIRLAMSAPGAAERGKLLAALDQGAAERRTTHGDGKQPPFAPRLRSALRDWGRATPDDVTLLRLLCRAGDEAALSRAVARAADPALPVGQRVPLLEVIGEVGTPAAQKQLVALIGGTSPLDVQLAALAALRRVADDRVAADLLALYPRLPETVRSRTRTLLLSRKSWAAGLLRAVDSGTIAAKDVTLDELRAVAAHGDRSLDDLVRKHWGNIRGATPEEKLAEVRRLNNDLRASAGNPVAGRDLFRKHCASCHRLFNEGTDLGPDLTHANRGDRDYLLVSIVDPSAVVRREYLAYVLHTTDGRVLTGLIADQTALGVTIVNAKNERTLVPRSQIDSLQESSASLMPENLLKELKPQELRDLFAYLQGQRLPTGKD
jgi:putative membrane-bound dehydrogenase-like protein